MCQHQHDIISKPFSSFLGQNLLINSKFINSKQFPPNADRTTMQKKTPRPRTSFLPPPRIPTRPLNPSRHPPPKCAAVKLLVVDLPTLLQNMTPAALVPFSERVRVDRRSSQDTIYLLYTTHFNYQKSMDSIRDAGLVEPDALAALDGSELYQRRYRTPDPYWAKKVSKDWDPKPAAWVVQTFFPKELARIEEDDSGEYELGYEVKEGQPNEVCERVKIKLVEMGVKGRSSLRGERLVISPAVGNVADVVGFCQMMLRIPQESTFVFGGENLVRSCVEGKANRGICGKDQGDWADDFDQVFVSAKEGADAVVEGVLHHAVF